MMMGMYNSKEISDLIGAFIGMGIFVFLSYVIGAVINEKLAKRILVKGVINYKAQNFKNIKFLLEHTSLNNPNMSHEEVNRTLRAYAIYKHPKNEYNNIDTSRKCADNILYAVTDASAIALKNSSSDSGCSGCSSCGSCGSCGGCGGCGGCGD